MVFGIIDSIYYEKLSFVGSNVVANGGSNYRSLLSEDGFSLEVKASNAIAKVWRVRYLR